MAKASFPLNIDRRLLLASAVAAATTTAIVWGVKSGEVAAPDDFQSSQRTPKAKPANFSAATARRLREIARRNEIRHVAQLPPLAIPKELRRMKQQEDLEVFRRFEAAHGKAVLEQVLQARREAEGNPQWRPNWMEGMAVQNQVREMLWEQFHAGTPRSRLKSVVADSLAEFCRTD
jgi:hypothetical protein